MWLRVLRVSLWKSPFTIGSYRICVSVLLWFQTWAIWPSPKPSSTTNKPWYVKSKWFRGQCRCKFKVQEVGLLRRSATLYQQGKVGSLVILVQRCNVTQTHVNCQIPSHVRTRLKVFINKKSILNFSTSQGWVHMTTLQSVRHRFTSSCRLQCKES